MRLLVTLVPEQRVDGMYLHIFHGTANAEVGPIQDRAELQAIIEQPDAPPPPRGVSKRMRKRSQREERELAESIGGRTQKASGALAWAKGDIRKRGKHRIENKLTGTKTYRVTRQELDKIRGECVGTEKPAFIITFINPGTQRLEDRWVLMPYEDWHEAHVDRGSGD